MDSFSENNFCFSLPKIELHAHLNGSLQCCQSVTIVTDLLLSEVICYPVTLSRNLLPFEANRIFLQTKCNFLKYSGSTGSLSDQTLPLLGCHETDLNEYQKLRNVPVGQRNLQDCFKLFAIAHKATSSPEAVFTATKNVITEFAKENVIYLELRTTPRSEEGMSTESYIECVIRAIREAETGILVKLILSLNRQHSMRICQENLDLILKMKFKYPDIIKGIDLSGNPVHGSFEELKNFFEKARENGLSTTIHCGEVVNSKEIREILEFKPDRIGHACYLHPNYNGCKQNWNILKELDIPTEICLTSNIITGARDIYENHHVQEWIRDNLPFSLNTDDKGVFDTTPTKEFQCIMKYFKLSPSDLWKISINSIHHCFADEDEKLILKKKLEYWKDENPHFFTSDYSSSGSLINKYSEI